MWWMEFIIVTQPYDGVKEIYSKNFLLAFNSDNVVLYSFL